MRQRKHRWRWVVAGAALAALLVVGVPYAYTQVIAGDAPGPLSVSSSGDASGTGAAATPAAGGMEEGTWVVADGSEVGYRVQEVLLGQDAVAVGRTSAVTGELTFEGSQVTSASFEVDMTTVTSDEDKRDQQFQGRIMETSTHPAASFELTEPIDLSGLPADGTAGTAPATGELTLHGTTQPVTVDLTVQRDGDTVSVSGSIPVTFADYGIANPSFGPVTTEDHGEVELLLVLEHA